MIESVPILFDYNEGDKPSPYSDDQEPSIRHKPCFVCATCHEAIRCNNALVLTASFPKEDFKEHWKLIIIHPCDDCISPYRKDLHKRYYGYAFDSFIWMVLRASGINRVDFFLKHSTKKERAHMKEALQNRTDQL
jgi:hypothetical protein